MLDGELDVLGGDMDVADGFPLMLGGFDGALVLVQEGDGANEHEVFHVISTGAGFVTEEGELIGVGVGDEEGLQEALGVAVTGEHLLTVGIAE